MADDQRFDELVRILATPGSRRRALRGLLGSAVAGAIALRGGSAAA